MSSLLGQITPRLGKLGWEFCYINYLLRSYLASAWSCGALARTPAPMPHESSRMCAMFSTRPSSSMVFRELERIGDTRELEKNCGLNNTHIYRHTHTYIHTYTHRYIHLHSFINHLTPLNLNTLAGPTFPRTKKIFVIASTVSDTGRG